MPQDYSWITNDMFAQKLGEIVEEQRHNLLSIPGVWEEASEELNNEALERGGDFEDAIQGILTGMEAITILAIPGMYEVLSEEFNNDVLKELEEEREEGSPASGDDEEDDPNWREDERGWVKLKPGHPDYKPPRGASVRRKADRTQEQEDLAWELGQQYGQDHPLAEVGSTEEMHRAAQEMGCPGMFFDVFKYGAQDVWRKNDPYIGKGHGRDPYSRGTGRLPGSSYAFSKEGTTKMKRHAVSESQISNYDEWVGEYPVLIIYSYDGRDWEVVDGAQTNEEAQELLGEYRMAFGPGSQVQIYGESPRGGRGYSRGFDRPPGIYGSSAQRAFAQYKKAQMDADITLLKKSMDTLGKTKNKGEAVALLRDISDAALGIIEELGTKTASTLRSEPDMKADYAALTMDVNALQRVADLDDLVLVLGSVADSAGNIIKVLK